MKILFALFVIILLVIVSYYARISYIISQAKLEHVVPLNRIQGSGPSLKYVAAGDSTAVGVGASTVEKTYTYLLVDRWALNRSVDYVNVAVTGSQTSDMLEKQLAEIVLLKPDVVTISIGANDLTHWVMDKKILANYKVIILTLTEQTGATVYLTNIAAVDRAPLFPQLYRKALAYRVEKLNLEIAKMGTDRVKIVNIHDVKSTFARDRFHPDDEAYANWANAFLSVAE